MSMSTDVGRIVAILKTHCSKDYAKGLWSALDRLEFSSTSVLLGELVAIMLENKDVGFPLKAEECQRSAGLWNGNGRPTS